MKKLLIILLFIGCFCVSSKAQDKIEVTQDFLDSATRAFDLVVEQRDAIEKLKAERSLSEVERKSADLLIKGLNDLLLLKDKTIEQYQKMIQIQQQIIEFQQQIIEKLQNMLKKPKSLFDKVLKVLKEVSLIFGGIILGRGL